MPSTDGGYLQRIDLKREVRESLPFRIRHARDVARYLLPVFEGEHREMFVVVPLNAKHRPLGYHIAHVGYANGCPVHMREVLLPCILSGACAFICAHNHPSGDPSASPEDAHITSRLQDAGELMGIQYLDHLVFGSTRFYSSADRISYPYTPGEL